MRGSGTRPPLPLLPNMSTTRAQVETILVQRRGPLMAAAGMPVTYAGSNAALNDPIGYAVRRLGGTVTTITSVADADVATVSTDDLDAMLDVAELRLLRSIKGNLDDVDIRSGPFQESYSQLMSSVNEDINALQKKVSEEYGIGGVTTEVGTIVMDFAERGTESTDDDI